ncbi:uncharacterized protein Dana_GF15964 [Drosophila ananassae]|uniref:Uncharacterized protein n=1 Tax=Drosophila ananassae TaxID=7217 RepID=B3N117_DROAN|nr:uncharacterized protein LOC6498765 [Drosophila ananassae]EDV30052.1 uncharacterized protein Dana_GF15964 [Drosophila ananassae]
MVELRKPVRMFRIIKAFLTALYNDRFCWTFIKSYGLFALAIPIAKAFDGYELLPRVAPPSF